MCFQSRNLADDAFEVFLQEAEGAVLSLIIVSPVLGTCNDHSMGSESMNSRMRCPGGDEIPCLWIHPFGLDGEGGVQKQIMTEVE